MAGSAEAPQKHPASASASLASLRSAKAGSKSLLWGKFQPGPSLQRIVNSRQEEGSEGRREQHGTQPFPVPPNSWVQACTAVALVLSAPTPSRSRRFGSQRVTRRFTAGRCQVFSTCDQRNFMFGCRAASCRRRQGCCFSFGILHDVTSERPMLRRPRGLGAVPKERQARRHPLRLCASLLRFCELSRFSSHRGIRSCLSAQKRRGSS